MRGKIYQDIIFTKRQVVKRDNLLSFKTTAHQSAIETESVQSFYDYEVSGSNYMNN